MVLMIGWFAFIWLVLWGYYQTANIRIIIALSGLSVCIFGGFAFNTLLKEKQYWMSLEELTDYIEKHKISIKLYDEAKDKLIKKIEES